MRYLRIVPIVIFPRIYNTFSGGIGKQLSNYETFLVETRQINIQPVKKVIYILLSLSSW